MKLNKIPKISYFVFIVGLIIIGVLIFIQTKLPASTLAPSPTITQPMTTTQPIDQTTTSTQSQIDAYDWKTYRNEEFGFGFKYPEGYKVMINYDPHGPQHLLGGFLKIGLNLKLIFEPYILTDRTLEEMTDYLTHRDRKEGKIQGKQVIYVAGEKAIKVRILDNGIFREEIYFRGKSKKENIHYPEDEWKYTWRYIFKFQQDPKGLPKHVFDQIVLSFEFIE